MPQERERESYLLRRDLTQAGFFLGWLYTRYYKTSEWRYGLLLLTLNINDGGFAVWSP